MKRIAETLLATAVVAASAAGVPTAPASVLREQVAIESPTWPGSAQDAILQATATKVLRHIAAARADVHRRDALGARKELAQARTLLEIIEAALPTTEVRDRIWIANKHLEYEDTQRVLLDLVPVETSLDELRDLAPVEAVRRHLSEARKALREGDRQRARTALADAGQAIGYTEVDLPVHGTQQSVDAASEALERGDLSRADQVLKGAEGNLVFLSFALESPLHGAEQTLRKATQRFAASAYGAAQQDLGQAIAQLQGAAGRVDPSTRDALSRVLEEARALRPAVVLGGKETGRALKALWQRVAALSERNAEQALQGLLPVGGKPRAAQDLAEARLHLVYARIDEFTVGDANLARGDLRRAEADLDRAAGHADKVEGAAIRSLRAAVSGLAEVPQPGSAEADANRYARYQAIIGELRRLARRT
jgi:hypothetical protein